MKKVLTTTQYNIEQYALLKKGKITHVEYAEKTGKYAKLMATPVELGMFVPCVDGKPLKELIGMPSISQHDYNEVHKDEIEVYEQAKEQVLFEGLEYNAGHYGWYGYKNGNPSDYVASRNYDQSIEWIYNTIEDVAQKVDLKPTDAFMGEFIKEEVLV